MDENGNPLVDETVRETWDFAVEAIERDLSAGFPQFSSQWNDGLAESSFASVAAPSWMRSVIQSLAPETGASWALVPVPGVGGNWGGSQLTAPIGGDNHEQAARFVQFMTNEESQRTLFIENSNFPTITSFYESPEILQWDDTFFGGQPIGSLYAASVEALPSQSKIHGQREIDRLFSAVLREVNGDADEPIEDVWQEFRMEALDIIENGPVTEVE